MSYPAQQAGTRRNLTLAALELFARDGVDAVSLRTINNHAGAKNASAVHYHFGNKLGIVEAVAELIWSGLDALRLQELAQLEARVESGQKLESREILFGIYNAYLSMIDTEDWGIDAIRFMARLNSTRDLDIQAILARDPNGIAKRFDKLLADALPDMPPRVRRTRYLLNWTMLVHGLASTANLAETVFGDLRAASRREAQMHFFDYLVGAMEGPITTQ